MSSTRSLRTSDLARAVGVHPNTVRRYVDRGLIPPVERSPAGYRRFTERHLDCLRVAWLVYSAPYAGRALQQMGVQLVRRSARGELASALQLAHARLALVQAERAEADRAADLLERWAFGAADATGAYGLTARRDASASSGVYNIGAAARLLNVSIDTLRRWDRNGLIDTPRNPDNGYRRYGARELGRLRIIRLLSNAGYSVSAILRMLLQFDELGQGEATDLRRALDTPRPDEDIITAADRWLSTLSDHDRRAHALIATLEEMLRKQAAPSAALDAPEAQCPEPS